MIPAHMADAASLKPTPRHGASLPMTVPEARRRFNHIGTPRSRKRGVRETQKARGGAAGLLAGAQAARRHPIGAG